MATIAEERKAINEWDDYIKNLQRAAVVDMTETQEEKLRRMARLEKPGNDEEWFKYYFPNYYYAEPAPFHKKATQRVMQNPEWYEVRAWSRELAKSARTMMEVTKLALTGKKRSVLLVSASNEAAVRLLKPYKINFERNPRIINDYGLQESFGEWTESAFVIKKGCAFVAVGAGQTPRGLRNEEVRPDTVLMDDFDTDEDCRNPDTIDKKWDWFERAVYATRSISNPMLVIFCGNIIAEYCCIVKAREMADHSDVINIRDALGFSTWPNKNTEELIDRALEKISYSAQQGEYFNNPITNGKIFPAIYYKKLPPIKQYRFAVNYCDPSYKSGKKNDYKAVVLVGKYKDEYHVRRVFCRQTTTAMMLDWHYMTMLFVAFVTNVFYLIEWPWIDDSLKLEIQAANDRHKVTLPLKADPREKPEKVFRIESLLEPLNRNGKLWFNIDEKDTPDMKAMEAQFKALSPTSRAHDDGPDAVEGAIWHINSKTINDTSKMFSPRRPINPKRF